MCQMQKKDQGKRSVEKVRDPRGHKKGRGNKYLICFGLYQRKKVFKRLSALI